MIQSMAYKSVYRIIDFFSLLSVACFKESIFGRNPQIFDHANQGLMLRIFLYIVADGNLDNKDLH